MLDRWSLAIEQEWLDTKYGVYAGLVASVLIVLLNIGMLPSQATSTPSEDAVLTDYANAVKQDANCYIWASIARGNTKVNDGRGLYEAFLHADGVQQTVYGNSVALTAGNCKLGVILLGNNEIGILYFEQDFPLGDPKVKVLYNLFTYLNGPPSDSFATLVQWRPIHIDPTEMIEIVSNGKDQVSIIFKDIRSGF